MSHASSDTQKCFLEILETDPDLSVGVAAIKTLLQMLKTNQFATIQEIHAEVKATVALLRDTDKPITGGKALKCLECCI